MTEPGGSVGIVMRTKDRPLLLARALRSVVEQSYPAWTLTIVNDGGDPSPIGDLLAELDASARERIGVVHHATSLGMEGASKAGMDALATDLLVVHDDDDTWTPSFLEIAVRELRKMQARYPETAGVVTYSNLVREHVRGNAIVIDSVEPFNGWIPAGFLSLDRMLGGNVLPPISFLFERAAFERLDRVYEKVAFLGDWDFLIRFLTKFEIVVVPQYLAFYHWRPPEHASPYNNSVTAEIDRHRFVRQLLLNRWLRDDLAVGRFGVGAYANLRAHFTLTGAEVESPPERVFVPKPWSASPASPVERKGEGAIPSPRIAIVCAMANERETAVRFVDDVLAQVAGNDAARMFVVLDTASRDGTRELLIQHAASEPRLSVLWAPESRNVVNAHLHGYRAALGGPFDWILQIDAGYRHQPHDISRFLAAIEEAPLDCAFGSRFYPGGRFERTSLPRRALSFAGTKLANALLGTTLHDMTGGFQMFRRETLFAILDRRFASSGHFFVTEIKYRCRGLRVREIPITYRAASPSGSPGSTFDALATLFALWRKRPKAGIGLPKAVASSHERSEIDP